VSQLTIADIKRHCSAFDFDDDDALLDDLHKQAEEFVQKYLRRDLDIELPGQWPLGCTGAVKMLVAHWYDHRSAVSEVSNFEVPFGVRDLLAQYRDLSG